MRVVIRLQNHGYKNHPLWHIVAAPKYKNIKGRNLEHLGYWMPGRGKTFDRSIILNRNRIQYWLGMGAEPTRKVQKFLSNVDMWPSPVIQFGSKSLYERPQKDVKDSYKLNPYNLNQFQVYLSKVLEQEETSYLFRMAIQQQNLLQHFNEMRSEDLNAMKPMKNEIKHSDEPVQLENEIQQLKDQLNELRTGVTKLDQSRQELLINRINELYKIWRKQQIKNEFSQINSELSNEYDSQVTKKSIKQHLDAQKIQQKMKDMEALMSENEQLMKTISRDEFKEYILKNSEITETKAETLTRIEFRKARENGQQVLRINAVEACEPQGSIVNATELGLKRNLHPDDKIYIPITKPVTPLPDLVSYDPEDYYEIPKMIDPLSCQNKPYDLPNINDVHIPRKNVSVNYTFKNVSGRKRPKRLKTQQLNTGLYDVFSTYNKKEFNVQTDFRGAYMSYFSFKNLEQLIFQQKE